MAHAAGGAEGLDQLAAQQRLAHQRQPRQRHALAGQRGLDLLVGEVQVDPAPRLELRRRRAAAASAASSGTRRSAASSSSSSSVCRARSAGAFSGGACPAAACSTSRGLITGVSTSPNSLRRARRRVLGAGSSAARDRARGRRDRPARRWPRCGCRCPDARSGRAAGAAAATATRTTRRSSRRRGGAPRATRICRTVASRRSSSGATRAAATARRRSARRGACRAGTAERAELVFEGADLPADGRLRQMQLGRRGAEAQASGDRLEGADRTHAERPHARLIHEPIVSIGVASIIGPRPRFRREYLHRRRRLA